MARGGNNAESHSYMPESMGKTQTRIITTRGSGQDGDMAEVQAVRSGRQMALYSCASSTLMAGIFFFLSVCPAY
jgi:hypothetical protein